MENEIIEKIKEVCTSNKIKYRFEIEPNDNRNILSYLNFMGAINGIYIRSCDAQLNKQIIYECLNDQDKSNLINNINYIRRIVDFMDNKYKSEKKMLSKVNSVVILPGSNILDITIDYAIVNDAIGDGAYIKPHPYTTDEDIVKLKNRYGKKVLDKGYGGCDIIKNAKKIYITGASELSLYAIVLGKVVVDIGNNNARLRGGYCAIFDVLVGLPHYIRPIAIKKILSHKSSGIFFPFDYEEKDIEDFILKNF